MRVLNESEETDAEVTWEDQKQINTFSRLNSKLMEVEELLEAKKQEKEALDDLSMELELADEEESILYKVGEAFVSLPQSEASTRLSQDMEELEREINALKDKAEECEEGMKKLKVSLYGKFGNSIALER